MPSAPPEIEGETVGWTQPVHYRRDWGSDFVSQTNNPQAKSSAYRRLNRRTVARIQRNVLKQGERNVAVRFLLAKSDKKKIALWKQEFVRVLHIFNVRSLGPVERPRTQ